MKKNSGLIALLFALFFSAVISAQIDESQFIEPNEETVDNKKWEIWLDKVPISGNVRVGLMFDSDTKNKLNPEHFFAVIPKERLSSNLCVELSSKDGRYSAKIDYPIKSSDYGRLGFILPTKYKSALSKFNTNEVVILASLSNDCNSNPESYVLSSWIRIPPDAVKTNRVSVYVNSISPTTLILGENTAKPIECTSLEFPTVAYNKKCTIPVNRLDDKTSILIKQRKRRGAKVSFSTYKLPFRYFKNE